MNDGMWVIGMRVNAGACTAPYISARSTDPPGAPRMSNPQDYLPIALQTLIAVGFVVTTLLLTGKIGPKRAGKHKEENFECGIEQYGNARSPFSVKYFLIAILFVLFDVEIIFLYPWAVNFKDLGIVGFVEMVLFIFFVVAGLFYVIRKGALEWDR